MNDLPFAAGEPDDVRRMPAGVRANALAADYFSLLREVDHRVADAVLDALEDAGVAAYVEPAPPAATEGYTRPRFTTPHDRLYVDRDHRSMAVDVVAAELPGMLAELEPIDHDTAFEEIVAGWDAPAAGPVPPWPVHEDLDITLRDPAADLPRSLSVPVDVPDDPVEVDEGHYVPPPPPPLPSPDHTTKLAAAAIAFGFLVVFLLPGLGVHVVREVTYLGVAAILGGLATLVARLRDGPSVDDGPDDGAVV
ncbi:MAG TPA: hypothetical protein VNA12_00115 [Mycobacteriales bacterium]|nr:hypothetical protein [Mycobacteriales bacterium]